MASAKTIAELNRELAERLNDEAKKAPPSPYAGKKIGIANGQVVVVTDDWDDLGTRLRAIEPDINKRCCIEIGRDYGGVHEIWEAH